MSSDEEMESSCDHVDKELYHVDSFSDLNLSMQLIQACEELGYSKPTPVQAACISSAIKGHDIFSSAITGSEKTAAFALPTLERILHQFERTSPAVRVLILTPTRKSAVEVHSMVEKLALSVTPIRCCLVADKFQEVALRSKPDIVVATPEEMLAHIWAIEFLLKELAVLILDEADLLLEEFILDMIMLTKECPKQRQTMLFSGTMTEEVDDFIKNSMNNPIHLSADTSSKRPVKLTEESVVPKSCSIRRSRWERYMLELTGKMDAKYRHKLTSLLMESYYETGVFAHTYHIDGIACVTHLRSAVVDELFDDIQMYAQHGVSGLRFDSKGLYLASGTKLGCLTVHDFDSLYGMKEDEKKQLLHINTGYQIDAVQWNISKQDEVACTSMRSEVQIFDISLMSSVPVTVLRTSAVHQGFSDIAFTKHDDSRVLASDIHGVVNIWDRRLDELPCLKLHTNSKRTINSIQLDNEEQVIFGAGENGMIYVWDLRGGRSSADDMVNSPMAFIEVASMLNDIESLKAPKVIVDQAIQSIDINPNSPYQLAFNLVNGWSGAIEIPNHQVTHIHCPPPPCLDGSGEANPVYFKKPAWLSPYSFYAVGSLSSKGVYLLDFYPDPSSPCHVDYNDNKEKPQEENIGQRQSTLVETSESVTACAVHPFDGTIVAGTKQSSLLMISQGTYSCKTDN